MAMVNQMLNPLQVKDSRWLTLEVCREFQRSKCTRPETECKFAHPPPHVEVQNGRVTCCFDSIKGKCQRKDPPCKYLHPPQHLREQLLQNGRNNLILKNLQMQAMAAGIQPMVPPGMIPAMTAQQVPEQDYAKYDPYFYYKQAHPYLTTVQGATFNPYASLNPAAIQMTGLPPTVETTPNATVTAAAPGQGLQVQTTGVNNAQKVSRADRLEANSSSVGSGSETSWSGSAYVDSVPTATPTSQYSHVYFQGMSAVPGMGVPMVKRQAVTDNKSGIPVYQPGTNTAAYQQALAAMQLQQQPFVPVTNSLEFNGWGMHRYVAGHPPSVPRF